MEQFLLQLGQHWQSVVEYFAFDTALLSEPDMIVRICVQLFLLACSAFFSSSETALFSLSRLDLQQLRREQNPVFGGMRHRQTDPRADQPKLDRFTDTAYYSAVSAERVQKHAPADLPFGGTQCFGSFDIF